MSRPPIGVAALGLLALAASTACFEVPPRPLAAPIPDATDDTLPDTNDTSDTSDTSEPPPETLPSLAIGAGHLCYARPDRAPRCWGNGPAGQLGDLSAQPGPTPPVTTLAPPLLSLAAGAAHTCGIDADAILHCWGDNRSAQVGAPSALVPRPTPILPRVAQVAAGTATTCAILTDATVRCWGAPLDASTPADNVLDRPSTVWRTPTPIPGLAFASDIAVGRGFACALSAGAVRCFGNGERGELGRGPSAYRSATALPTHALPPADTSAGPDPDPDPAVELRAGSDFACARTARGTVACWGDNRRFQAGAPLGASTPSPTAVALPWPASALALGRRHACARSATGLVACWGDNTAGQLGRDDTTATPSPNEVPLPAPALAIHAGSDTTCATTATGSTHCWGEDSDARLSAARPPVTPRPDPWTPSPVDPELPNVSTINILDCAKCSFGCESDTCRSPIDLTVGEDHTCATLADSAVWCWGHGGEGRLARGIVETVANRPFPAALPPGARHLAALTASRASTCALDTDGVVACAGALSTSTRLVDPPADVLGSPSHPALAVASDTDRVCALVSGLGVLCRDSAGALSTTAIPQPDLARPLLALAADAACITTLAGIACWGANERGQLGRGRTGPPVALPAPVSPPLGAPPARVHALVGAGQRFCALVAPAPEAPAELSCWGANDRGALAPIASIPDQATSPTPIPIPTYLAASARPRAIALGPLATCLLTDEPELFCWGDNGAAALARDPSFATHDTPRRLRLPFTPTALAVGRGHACASAPTGHVACWGDDGLGQLGRGSSGAPSPSPILLVSPF